MEIVAILSVLIIVLVLSEYRHSVDRTEYKELALNQQNHIKELLEIIRFRHGMTTINPAEKPETRAVNESVAKPVTNSNEPPTPAKRTEKPFGYMARIKEQEREIETEKTNQSF